MLIVVMLTVIMLFVVPVMIVAVVVWIEKIYKLHHNQLATTLLPSISRNQELKQAVLERQKSIMNINVWIHLVLNQTSRILNKRDKMEVNKFKTFNKLIQMSFKRHFVQNIYKIKILKWLKSIQSIQQDTKENWLINNPMKIISIKKRKHYQNNIVVLMKISKLTLKQKEKMRNRQLKKEKRK